MKYNHVTAVFAFIFGGLLAYIQQFHHGDTDGAIQTGIIFILLGTVMFFLDKLQRRFKPMGVVWPAILVGFIAYRKVMNGDIAWAIILVFLIIAVILQLFENTRFYKENKERIKPWLRPIPYIAIGVLLVMTLLLLFKG